MIDEILTRLEKVKRTGKGNWMACCPSHPDKSPSLTLHEAADGRILVHCHSGGCSFHEIVEAVGIGWEPWFPPKQEGDFRPAIRRPYPAGDVLEALASEALIVTVAACNLGQGIELAPEERSRLLVAMERIETGRRLANG